VDGSFFFPMPFTCVNDYFNEKPVKYFGILQLDWCVFTCPHSASSGLTDIQQHHSLDKTTTILWIVPIISSPS